MSRSLLALIAAAMVAMSHIGSAQSPTNGTDPIQAALDALTTRVTAAELIIAALPGMEVRLTAVETSNAVNVLAVSGLGPLTARMTASEVDLASARTYLTARIKAVADALSVMNMTGTNLGRRGHGWFSGPAVGAAGNGTAPNDHRWTIGPIPAIGIVMGVKLALAMAVVSLGAASLSLILSVILSSRSPSGYKPMKCNNKASDYEEDEDETVYRDRIMPY